MIEILQGIIQFFILFILFLFPITPQINNIFLKKYNFEIFDIICINLVLNLNCYLIISAFKIDLNILFAINFILAIAFLFLHFKKNIIFLKKTEFKVIFLFFIVNISLFFNSINDLSLMWDGLDHWIYKASAFFQGLGFVNTGNTSYPHLGGFVWGYFWKNSIVQKEYVGRLTFIFFYVSSLFYLINLFKKSNLDIYKLIFVIVILALTYDKKLFGGYQDYLIFSLLIIISKLLYLIINNDGKKIFLETIFFLSAYILCWIKQEGFVYFIMTVFLLILFEKEKRKKIFFSFSFFTLTCIYFFLKKFFNTELSFDQKLNFNFLLTTNFSLLIEILKTITYNLIIATFKYPIWMIILISIILSLTEKRNNYQFRYFYIFLIMNIFFVYSLMIYTCLNLKASCELISKVSLDRIIFQMSGFYLVFIIIFLANKKIIKN